MQSKKALQNTKIMQKAVLKTEALTQASTTTPQTTQPPSPAREPSLLEQQRSSRSTRLLRVKVQRPEQLIRMMNNISFPVKHTDRSQVGRGVIALYFLSLAHSEQMYNWLAEVDCVVELSYHQNLSTFEHVDTILFENHAGLSENNIVRFLENVDRIVFLKKLSMKRFLVKFDSILVRENLRRLTNSSFWQFDQRYYDSVICFTEQNYDYVYIQMTNPLHLKQESRLRARYRNMDTRINFSAIMDQQDARTTIMIKNIPNRIQKSDLVEIIDQKFYGAYDFIYLPIDFQVVLLF